MESNQYKDWHGVLFTYEFLIKCNRFRGLTNEWILSNEIIELINKAHKFIDNLEPDTYTLGRKYNIGVEKIIDNEPILKSTYTIIKFKNIEDAIYFKLTFL